MGAGRMRSLSGNAEPPCKSCCGPHPSLRGLRRLTAVCQIDDDQIGDSCARVARAPQMLEELLLVGEAQLGDNVRLGNSLLGARAPGFVSLGILIFLSLCPTRLEALS